MPGLAVGLVLLLVIGGALAALLGAARPDLGAVLADLYIRHVPLFRLFGLPMVMPVIVAIFAIVAVYGESGWLHRLAAWLGLPLGSFLYGLCGILIAHVFFNMPFAARALLAALESVPGESWRLASQLGMKSDQV